MAPAKGVRSASPRASSETARRTMVANRSRDTSPEVALRQALHRRGLRFRKHARLAPLGSRRTVDIVFPTERVAVFVHGCFWHGCETHMTWPAANAEFWRAKIDRNRARDKDSRERLDAAGWDVMTVWEHDDVDAVAGRVEEAIRRRRRHLAST